MAATGQRKDRSRKYNRFSKQDSNVPIMEGLAESQLEKTWFMTGVVNKPRSQFGPLGIKSIHRDLKDPPLSPSTVSGSLCLVQSVMKSVCHLDHL